MGDCIHGINSRTCAFCRVEWQRGERQVQMSPPPPPAPASVASPTRVYCACPHGYLVHGAGGCWKCECSVSWSELIQRGEVADGPRSKHFPGAKRKETSEWQTKTE